MSENHSFHSVADPGYLSRIRIFSHPGTQKTWGGKKKIFFLLFSYLFVAFRSCWNRSWLITVAHFIIFEKRPFWEVNFFFLEKKNSPLKRLFFKFSDTKNDSRKKVKKLLKIKKCFKLSEIMVGSGIRKKPIPDPGGKKVPDPDPQHWFSPSHARQQLLLFMMLCTYFIHLQYRYFPVYLSSLLLFLSELIFFIFPPFFLHPSYFSSQMTWPIIFSPQWGWVGF